MKALSQFILLTLFFTGCKNIEVVETYKAEKLIIKQSGYLNTPIKDIIFPEIKVHGNIVNKIHNIIPRFKKVGGMMFLDKILQDYKIDRENSVIIFDNEEKTTFDVIIDDDNIHGFYFKENIYR